jgi:hypothetical protein
MKSAWCFNQGGKSLLPGWEELDISARVVKTWCFNQGGKGIYFHKGGRSLVFQTMFNQGGKILAF